MCPSDSLEEELNTTSKDSQILGILVQENHLTTIRQQQTLCCALSLAGANVPSPQLTCATAMQPFQKGREKC